MSDEASMPDETILKLMGLKALALQHYRMVESIHKATCAITGEPDNAFDHTADFCFSGEEADAAELLENTARYRAI